MIPAVLRGVPQFRLLFAGLSLSAPGDRITFVALPLAVLEAGGGAAEVGLVAGATTLPFFAFSPVAGVYADRLDRRALMPPLSEVLGLEETLMLMSAIGVAAAAAVLSVPSVRQLARP